MKSKLWIALALVLVLLLAVSACDDGDKPVDTPTNESDVPESVEEETEPTWRETIELDLPEYEIKDKTITILGTTGGWASKTDIFADELNNNTVNDAVWERNQAIADDYGVEIEFLSGGNEPYGSATSFMYNLVAGGDNSVDIVNCSILATFKMGLQHLLADLNSEIDYIDFSQPWWDAGMREAFTIQDRLFFAVSDMNNIAYQNTWVMLYNKRLMDNLGYEDDFVFDSVRDGTWTLDTYGKIVKGYAKDLNNDNQMTEVDQYGTAFQSSGPDGFLLAAGMRYSERDEDGNIVFKPLDDKGLAILNKVTDLCKAGVSYNSHNKKQNTAHATDPDNGRAMYREARAIFWTETLGSVEVFRDMEDDFGIIPLPKYDEEQETYKSFIHHGSGTCVAVPRNAEDLSDSGYMLEVLSNYSYNMVTPKYFGRVVEGKYSRDVDSLDMLYNYVTQDRIVEMVIVGRYNNFCDQIVDAINQGNPIFASLFKRSQRAVETGIQETNDAYANY